MLAAAVFERAGGLAFEVDDEEVGVGPGLGAEQLAKMVVAVDADALAEEGCVAVEGLDAGEKGVLLAEQCGGERSGVGGNAGRGALEGVEG